MGKNYLMEYLKKAYHDRNQEDIPNAILEEAKIHTVYLMLKDDPVYVARNIKILYEHCFLSKLLTQHNIDHVFIKGWASSYYYPHPIRRQLGDVDIYIHKTDLERVENILLMNQYIPYSKESDHHHNYFHNGIEIELHWRINGVEKFEEYFQTIIDEAFLIDTPLGSIPIPSSKHHGMILLIHMATHLQSSGIGLRHICDLAYYYERTPNFQALLEEELRKLGLWTFTIYILELCAIYLDLDIRVEINPAHITVINALLEDILGLGNFGIKHLDTKESWFISSHKEGNIIQNMLANLSERVEYVFPKIKRFKILYPIGYITLLIRYCFRVIIGTKRGFRPIKSIYYARKRRKLYKQLMLFRRGLNV